MRRVRVLKFGGASLRDAASVHRVCGLVQRFGGERPVVVVSAIEGVTRLLEASLEEAARGRLVWDGLRIRHRSLLTELGLRGDLLDRHLFDLCCVLTRLAEGAAATDDTRPVDFVLAFGERMSARVVAAALAREGQAAVPVDAYDAGLVTRGSGALTPPSLGASRLRRALAGVRGASVVTGFLALDAGGHVTTLGPNGSDLSAVWIGAALEAREVQLWKEVPGILRADPAVVGESALLRTIGRDEAASLARHGAQVLHPAALGPARGSDLEVWLRDVRDPGGPGTRIVAETRFAGPLAIARRAGLSLLELAWSERVAPDGSRPSGTRAGALAVLFEWLRRAGAELVGCQAGPERVQVLVAARRELRAPPGLSAAPHLRRGLASVTVVGRGLAAGDVGERLLASARALDPDALPWADAASLGVLVREPLAAACVRAAHDELFGRDRLESPAAG